MTGVETNFAGGVRLAASAVALATLCCAQAGGGQADFFAKDLTPLDKAKVKVLKPDAIPWIRDGAATMPIVAPPGKRRYGPRGWEFAPAPEAELLARIVFEMTGVKPPVVIERPGTAATNSPAVFVGVSACRRFAGEAAAEAESFRVASENGSLYFAGQTSHAVADFAERVLGVRAYWEGAAGGWSYVKTPTLSLPEIDYSDAPAFPRRTMWPFAQYDWYPMWKPGDSFPVGGECHQPHSWWRDTNFNYRVKCPEIFQLGRDGKRQPPMLCYGNPKTLEIYKERLELELAGGPKAGMYFAEKKTIVVSQWDGMIDCQCEHCKPLYDESRGTTGNASPIIWRFAAKLADWLHERHPDITVWILPYLNTCDVPEGVAFPHGNVQAEVCSMPGLALFKNEDVREREENLILAWEKLTGRPVASWHYICWPSEFCGAPYLFGHTAADHFRRMRGHVAGAFMNGTGTPPERRQILSAYVWMRALWNPEIDVEAIYDGMCERMFGAAAKTMRTLIAMQERGWNRQWPAGQVSNRNIYEISYPRDEVVEMERLVAKAREEAAGDPVILKRIDRYTEGFAAFFEESRMVAEGTALEPTLIKKVASDPIIDGRLDDEAWKLATAYPFVHATCKTNPATQFQSEVRMVWTPNGVTVGLKALEPEPDAETKANPHRALEEFEIFLDVSGTGEGHYYQIFMNETGDPLYYTDGIPWQPKGIRHATHFGSGFWSLEIFIPFDDLKGFPGAQMPSGTSAEGKFWLGNVMRHRRSREFSRRYTRYSVWSKDPAAFGKLVFVE